MLLRKFRQPPGGSKLVSLGSHHNLELHVGQVIKTYNIDTIIDVGANEGQFGQRMRRMAFGGDIYSFEPVKETYERLVQTAAGDSGWKIYNIALGDRTEQTQINVSESSDLSSILDSNEFGRASFEGIKSSRKEAIAVHRLDEFIPQVMGVKGRRILLKIDSQGYDAQVFEGAKGLLPSICGLVSELSLIPIYHGMKHYLEMLDIYQKNGFSVSGIYPVSRNGDNLSLIEIDCVMVNQKLY